MKHGCVFGAAAWVFAGILVAPAEGYEPPAALDGLVRIALGRNRELLAARQQIAEQRGLLRQAGMRSSPGVEVGYGTGRPLGTAGEQLFSAGLSYQIETSGKRSRRVDAARKSVDLAEAEVARQAWDLVSTIKIQYYEAVANRMKAETLERLIEINRESLRLVQARVEHGDAAPLDRDLLLVEMSRAEAQLADFRGREQSALIELRSLASLRADEGLAVAEPNIRAPGPLPELQRLALEQRSDLRTARVREDLGRAELSLAEAQARPDVNLSAGYTRETARFDQFGVNAAGARVQLLDTDNILSVGVSIPLLTRRKNAGNIEAAEARRAGARLRREHLEATIPIEVEAAYLRWTAAHRMREIIERGVIELSEKNLEIIRQAHVLGQLRTLDVLNEQRRLVETRLAYADSIAGMWRALVDLERAVGGSLQ